MTSTKRMVQIIKKSFGKFFIAPITSSGSDMIHARSFHFISITFDSSPTPAYNSFKGGSETAKRHFYQNELLPIDINTKKRNLK